MNCKNCKPEGFFRSFRYTPNQIKFTYTYSKKPSFSSLAAASISITPLNCVVKSVFVPTAGAIFQLLPQNIVGRVMPRRYKVCALNLKN